MPSAPAIPSVPANLDVDAAVPVVPAEPSVSAEPVPPPRKRRPFEVHSACTDVVTIAFVDDPKAPNTGKRTLAPNATIEGPRNADGNQTVVLLDDAGEPLAKVNVTRGMKRVEIGRSCRTLDAR